MSATLNDTTPAQRCMTCPVHCVEPLPAVALSPREREVLRTWLLAPSKRDAAAQLYISMGTINTHLGRIRAKYLEAGRGASTKSALLARALQDEIVFLHEF